MKKLLCLPALPAACALLLLVAPVSQARADTADDVSVTRAMGPDNPALLRAAISQIFGKRPMSREEAGVPAAPAKLDLASIDSLPRPTAGGDDQRCLAEAIYFESRGEPLEGQVAVAEVVLNRAASGEYPRSICDVVTQPAQFSFVRDGHFPAIDRGSDAWRKAVAVAHIAAENLADTLSSDVLWYHADYVAPGWGRRLDRVTQIGAHIFYRRG